MSEKVIGELLEEGDPIYSNFDHKFMLTEEDVKNSNKYHAHYAWDFMGKVWYDKAYGGFKEEIWLYHRQREVLEAETLEELIEKVNEKYGMD